MGDARYEMVMTSLPYHGRLFAARQTPISRFQLEKRLAWLDPGDADVIRCIEGVLQWRRQLLDQTDASFLEQAHDVIDSLDNPLLCEVVQRRLEARTLIAALRMRISGQAAPTPGNAFGFGRWLDVIRRHWREPDFGLAHVFPWIGDADNKLRTQDAVGLERLIMGQAWQELATFGADHYFDLEAVAIYVLRWDLIDRWTQYKKAVASARILELANDGLGRFAKVFH